MSTEGCFTLPFGIIYDLKKYISIHRMWKKAIMYTGAPVKINHSIFNLQFLRHFCMEFEATTTSRSIVRIPF